MLLLLSGLAGCISSTETRAVSQNVIKILKRETHLGGDGTGIALINTDKKIVVEKHPVDLIRFLNSAKNLIEFPAITGIGNLRFATHGRPSVENTPPLSDCSGNIYVVFDGIIKNYEDLRDNLAERGHILASRNDAEILAHMLEEKLENDKKIEQALMEIGKEVEGHYAAVFLFSDDPTNLVFLVKDSRIVIGLEDNQRFLASEMEALIGLAKKYFEVCNGIGLIGLKDLQLYDLNGHKSKVELKNIPESIEYKVPGGFQHFMIREIFEIPDALKLSLIVHQRYYLELLARMVSKADKIYLIGSGSSYYACMLSAYLLRELAGIGASVIEATEFPYYALKDVTPGTVVIALSQSGKTTDVLRAVTKAKMYGASIIGIINAIGSPLMYASNIYLPIGVGPERAVPATKSFLGQVMTMYKVALKIAEMQETMNHSELNNLRRQLHALPNVIKKSIKKIDLTARTIAEKIYRQQSMFVASRGLNYPIALEGALKFKEVAYIHAEGIEAGELRHGPKSIITDGFPVILVMPHEKDARDDAYSLLYEAMELGANPIIITDENDIKAGKLTDNIIYVPEVEGLLTPFVNVIPLQLLAYYIGVLRGNPIDAPRGLTKYIILKQK